MDAEEGDNLPTTVLLPTLDISGNLWYIRFIAGYLQEQYTTVKGGELYAIYFSASNWATAGYPKLWN